MPAAVLGLAAVNAFGATYDFYVDQANGASANAGTEAAPKKYLGEALTLGRAQAGANTINVHVRAGQTYNTSTNDRMHFDNGEDDGDTYVMTGWRKTGDAATDVATIGTAGAWGNPRFASGCGAVSFTFGEGIARVNSAGNPCIYVNTTDIAVTLDGCTLTNTGGYAAFECGDTTQSCSLTIRNGATVSSDGNLCAPSSLKSFSATDSTLTTTGAGKYILNTGSAAYGISDLVQFNRCTINSAAGVMGLGWDSAGAITSYLALVDVRDCTINIAGPGFPIVRYVRRCTIENNTITSNQTGAAAVMVMGFDSGTAANTFTTGGVIVRNNIVRNIGSDAGHGIEIGKGCNGAVCTGNTVLDCDYGIVIKGNYVMVAHNVVAHRVDRTLKGACLHLSGGQGNVLRNNSLYSTVTNASAIEVKKNLESVQAAYNTLEDNLVHVTHSGAVCIVVETNAGFDENRINRNVYWVSGSATNIAKTGTSSYTYYTTFEALQAFWANYTKWAGNEAYSVKADPRFRSPATGDLRLGPGSPALGTRATFWINQGAWQRGEMTGKQPFWRLAQPAER